MNNTVLNSNRTIDRMVKSLGKILFNILGKVSRGNSWYLAAIKGYQNNCCPFGLLILDVLKNLPIWPIWQIFLFLPQCTYISTCTCIMDSTWTTQTFLKMKKWLSNQLQHDKAAVHEDLPGFSHNALWVEINEYEHVHVRRVINVHVPIRKHPKIMTSWVNDPPVNSSISQGHNN